MPLSHLSNRVLSSTDRHSEKPCPSAEEIDTYLDGEGLDTARRIRSHLQRCTACAAYAAQSQEINATLRLLAKDIRLSHSPLGPEDLAKRPTHRRLTRRGVLFGAAIAGSGAGVFLVQGGLFSASAAYAMPPQLFADFRKSQHRIQGLDQDGDLETNLLSGRGFEGTKLDLAAQEWLQVRGQLGLPEVTIPDDLSLTGVRLCSFFSRKIAVYHMGTTAQADTKTDTKTDTSVCLYATNRHKLELASGAPLEGKPKLVYDNHSTVGAQTNSVSTHSGLFWQRGPLAFGLVSNTNADHLKVLCSALRASNSVFL